MSTYWQESWDRQQESYMPDREHRLSAMLDAVEALTDGAPPRLLDLAGGTGTITLRALARFPGAEATLLDQDPVLLAIARASLAGRATVVNADLSTPEWITALPGTGTGYDAVLTATALHWLPAERVAALYAEIRDVLRPGGVFANADHMPDEALGGLTKRLIARADAHREPGTRPARRSPGATGGSGWPPTSRSPRCWPSATASTPPSGTAPSGPRRPAGTWTRCATPASRSTACCGGAAPTRP